MSEQPSGSTVEPGPEPKGIGSKKREAIIAGVVGVVALMLGMEAGPKLSGHDTVAPLTSWAQEKLCTECSGTGQSTICGSCRGTGVGG